MIYTTLQQFSSEISKNLERIGIEEVRYEPLLEAARLYS